MVDPTNSTKLTLFTLSSGRSGTSYLADFFTKNVLQCYSTHEPYLTYGNPTLFGKPVDWNTHQNESALLPVLERKCRFIASRKAPVYFESSHAFLKTFNRHAGALLNNAGLIHLVRPPALVAKSELLREQFMRSLRLPYVDYISDSGKRVFRWALTGDEKIFRYFAGCTLSRLQFYLLQWVEIEYRATQLIKQNKWQNRVFFIDVNRQLKVESILMQLVKFFDLPHTPNFNMNLRRNTTPLIGPTRITAQNELEIHWITKNLPDAYKTVFNSEPYTKCLSLKSFRKNL